MSKLARFYHTVRYLRPIQVYGRLRFRAFRPRPDLSPSPGLRAPTGRWVTPAEREPSMTSAGTFQFLNETRALQDIGWDDSRLDNLWRYNLHYFNDLNAIGAAERVSWHETLIDRWVRENPPGRGTAWEPYPTSLRIVNWIKWAQTHGALRATAVHSLAVQARWLERRLEHHLLGNHLFANAKALLFAGLFFSGPEAEKWIMTASHLLMRETREQILGDGGHFELSPLYHALALEDLLDMVNLRRRYEGALPGSAYWLTHIPDSIARMRSWLIAMCHPDGEIGLFNDAAFGVAPSPSRLESYSRALGLDEPGEEARLLHLEESGYIHAREGEMLLLADVARIGPDYLPGHAHADTLSFELSVGPHRILVNSGTSVYGTGKERLRQRGTPAHNTVTVNDMDSSEVWAGFRVARRARPFDLSIERGDRETRIECAHDGYKRLPGSPVHRRAWTFGPGWLRISDRIQGPHESAIAAFLFHPDVLIRCDDPLEGKATRGGFVLDWRILVGQGTIGPATYHPRFGQSLPTSRLRVALIDGQAEILIRLGER